MADFLGVWVEGVDGPGYKRVVHFEDICGVPSTLELCERTARDYISRGYPDAIIARYPARDHCHVAHNVHAAQYIKRLAH